MLEIKIGSAKYEIGEKKNTKKKNYFDSKEFFLIISTKMVEQLLECKKKKGIWREK